MKEVTTKEVTKELLNREGISSLSVEPYEKVKITTGQGEREFTGPAIIIINQD
ncbi:MAG: BC1881 family protein [Bacillota bacterium]